ncbi:MAG: glycosyltransferase family 25 protein [Bacteroidota bacterium]
MKGFIVTSVHEPARQQNVQNILAKLQKIERVEAFYPAFAKVPFLNRIKEIAKQRTGQVLRNGEVGCLLSHRKIWQLIIRRATNDRESFLVLESDSRLCNLPLLEEQFGIISHTYDLFFWGAWDGHMQLLRSTRQKLGPEYSIGEPFIKTVYCTYGYSLNRKAAAYLLKRTRKVAHPVDQFKKFIEPGHLKIGGIIPELISTLKMDSNIRPQTNGISDMVFRKILDIKNSFICFLR